MKKLQQIYSGKAKTLYKTDQAHLLIVEFRDDATAFNGVKKAQFAKKGLLNNCINAFLMQKLQEAGIVVHFEKLISSTESLVKELDMIRLECVVRNIASGSLTKRLGIKEGTELQPAIFEFFLKDDALGDPMINESHIRTFHWATEQEVATMKQLTFKVNEVLKSLFLAAGILLVDYKLEFGRFQGQLVLGDEITPDGCRLWDVKTRKILDKDRFRRDLGEVMESYEEVAKRLGVALPLA